MPRRFPNYASSLTFLSAGFATHSSTSTACHRTATFDIERCAAPGPTWSQMDDQDRGSALCPLKPDSAIRVVSPVPTRTRLANSLQQRSAPASRADMLPAPHSFNLLDSGRTLSAGLQAEPWHRECGRVVLAGPMIGIAQGRAERVAMRTNALSHGDAVGQVQTKDDMLVLCGVQLTSQGIGCSPPVGS